MSVALIIQYKMSMRLFILPSVTCVALHIFPHYLINGTIFWKKCILIFCKTCVWNISDSKEEFREILYVYIGLRVEYALFLSEINENWVFPIDFFEKYTNINFLENPSCGSWFLPCRWTDWRNESNSRFSQFYKRA